MRLTARLLILCLSLLSLPSFAETLGNLYQVHEPVASQQPDERNAGLTRALQTLVQRLTGDTRGLQSPALAGYFKDPQQLISQYGYENGPPLALVVDFDPTATDNALRQAGLPVWGASRPSVLAWWLNESTDDGSSLVGDSQEAAAPLNRAAQRRGLPLRLPMADLSEQQVGTAENLNAAQPDALNAASERYGADALLAVDAKEADGKWTATWRVWMGDSREQGQAQGDTPDALADAVMLGVSQRLSQRFVGSAGSASAQVLQIEGADLARYAEVSRLLEPMGAKLVLVQGGKLVYNVTASPEQLRAQLALARLQEASAEPTPPAVDANGQPVPNPAVPRQNILRFHW
ncbi:hypothetical protein H681_17925 [Pseudomonas sp. ATCC 13867]|uniref:DUF2066 domain-containing protein n=1 Tax=Pseudomonas sp. ATCC 13867 TaxID=1294143 RepID=UPI0002C4E23E|nr:DUF2066 domain-containing protein [Pseudomonas sp. ATCC 13867]AGI25452.1 hypothetical protein H681_17925 [Pseudomonas sp. ATCC 13867]RFQ34025.1 DUF2066 domain-containing protein [Pseudomonas sp. ATCC 13867]